jgi:hypothetical protein
MNTVRPLAWFAIAIALLVGCRSTDHPGLIVDQNGEGALVSVPGSGFGVDKTVVNIGEPWSAGSVTLCKKSADEQVTLKDVQPVSVRGQVRLDGIGVRATHYAKPNGHGSPDKSLVATMPGAPGNLQSPAGFEVPTDGPNSQALLGEIVVTLTKTGPEGGSLDGLRVVYTADGETHELTLTFHFGLCGTGDFAVPCKEGHQTRVT